MEDWDQVHGGSNLRLGTQISVPGAYMYVDQTKNLLSTGLINSFIGSTSNYMYNPCIYSISKVIRRASG